jgi:branched-chain amino acid transport system permease protein
VPDTPSQPRSLAQRAAALRPAALPAFAASIAPFAACLILAAVLQLVIKPMMGDFPAKLLLDIGTNVILAVSLTMVNGFSGQFSLGHAAFMAVGAYVAAGIVYYGSFHLFGNAGTHGGILSTMLGSGGRPVFTPGDAIFLGSIIVGGLFAAACGYIVGLPSLRLRGDYLAIVTLGFGEIVRVLIQSQTTDTLYDPAEIAATPIWKLPRYLGGPVGFSGLPFYSSLFWAWLFAGITLVTAYRLKGSTTGRAFLSIREDEIAAEAMGVATTKYKVRAFVIAAFFAGAAGAIYAHTVGVQLNAGELGFVKSFDIIIMVVLGGLGSISGSTLAAVILTLLPEILRTPAELSAIWPYAAAAAAAGAVIAITRRARPGALRAAGRLLVVVGGIGLVLAVLAFWAQRRNIELTQYRMVLFALGLILMMILRPEGLFGVKEIWDLLPRRGKNQTR